MPAPDALPVSLSRGRAPAQTARPSRPTIPARPRRLPWVHSTLRVTRERWRSWSGELESRPRRLYCDDTGGPWRSPRTLEDLQAIVADARAEGVSIRVFGSSHSWAALVPNDEGYIVDNRMIGAREGEFRPTLEAPSGPEGKAYATVAPGVLSSEFEDWLWDQGYSLPASAFEDCFTMAGMAATGTHGAGIDVGSISDMVVGMTFVDGHGRVRRWRRGSCSADELAAIQCGLGSLGLIYSITFEVEPRYEVLHIAKQLPYADYFADTDEARAKLRQLHEDHTSVEIFWWPFSFSGLPLVSRPQINPNFFLLATKREIPADTPRRGRWTRFWHLKLVDMFFFLMGGFFYKLFGRFPASMPLFAWFSCMTNLWVWAREGAFRMPQYDANHFVNATGVEFIPSVASEWAVPFFRDDPLDSARGYERLRRCFALLHDMVVESFEAHPFWDPRACPILTAVEMRTLRASGALLSPCYQPPQLREQVRYAAPELVTAVNHPAWLDFAQQANVRMTTDAGLGDEVRCHLAKPCQAWPHPADPVEGTRGYLREQYRAAGTWARFARVREDIDPGGVFTNRYTRAWFELPAVEEGRP